MLGLQVYITNPSWDQFAYLAPDSYQTWLGANDSPWGPQFGRELESVGWAEARRRVATGGRGKKGSPGDSQCRSDALGLYVKCTVSLSSWKPGEPASRVSCP